MVELQDVHTDENRSLPEKKYKRIVKTPNQIAALENFYNGKLLVVAASSCCCCISSESMLSSWQNRLVG